MGAKNKLVAYHPVHGYPIRPQEDLKTIKRNARERNRVQNVNKSFDLLRQHVPSAANYKKMSKVNIVHHALEYIHQLLYLVHQGSSEHHQQPLSTPTSCYPASEQCLSRSQSYQLRSPTNVVSPISADFTTSTGFSIPSSSLPSPGMSNQTNYCHTSHSGSVLSNDKQQHVYMGIQQTKHLDAYQYPSYSHHNHQLMCNQQGHLIQPAQPPCVITSESRQAGHSISHPVHSSVSTKSSIGLDGQDDLDVLEAILQWQTSE